MRKTGQWLVFLNAAPEYSNFQIGLLGVTLDAAIKQHPQMKLRYAGLQDFFSREVAAPLGMTDTVYEISSAMRARFPGPRAPSPPNKFFLMDLKHLRALS